jgi:UDP-N-acetylglucosamine 4-epimerase
VFTNCYGLETVGLRYFNVFGPRQDPNGSYAAVIPKWTVAMIEGDEVTINGDGETSRDFCYVANAVQANLLAATTDSREAINQAFNVAIGDQTSLNDLYAEIVRLLAPDHPHLHEAKPKYGPFRAGDVRHSLADVSKARLLLGYEPTHRLGEGLKLALRWYAANVRNLTVTA